MNLRFFTIISSVFLVGILNIVQAGGPATNVTVTEVNLAAPGNPVIVLSVTAGPIGPPAGGSINNVELTDPSTFILTGTGGPANQVYTLGQVTVGVYGQVVGSPSVLTQDRRVLTTSPTVPAFPNVTREDIAYDLNINTTGWTSADSNPLTAFQVGLQGQFIPYVAGQAAPAYGVYPASTNPLLVLTDTVTNNMASSSTPIVPDALKSSGFPIYLNNDGNTSGTWVCYGFLTNKSTGITYGFPTGLTSPLYTIPGETCSNVSLTQASPQPALTAPGTGSYTTDSASVSPTTLLMPTSQTWQVTNVYPQSQIYAEIFPPSSARPVQMAIGSVPGNNVFTNTLTTGPLNTTVSVNSLYNYLDYSGLYKIQIVEWNPIDDATTAATLDPSVPALVSIPNGTGTIQYAPGVKVLASYQFNLLHSVNVEGQITTK